MLIYDTENKRSLSSILIMLTPNEAHELSGSLKSINPKEGNHIHVDDEDFKIEITLAVYTPENLKFFSSDIREMLEKK